MYLHNHGPNDVERPRIPSSHDDCFHYHCSCQYSLCFDLIGLPSYFELHRLILQEVKGKRSPEVSIKYFRSAEHRHERRDDDAANQHGLLGEKS